MALSLLRKTGRRKLPEQVRTHLSNKFQLESGQVDRMRCVEKKGIFAGRPVRYIRVFDPDRMPVGTKDTFTYNEMNNYPEANLFDVRIEKTGHMYTTDLRPGHSRYPASPAPA